MMDVSATLRVLLAAGWATVSINGAEARPCSEIKAEIAKLIYDRDRLQGELDREQVARRANDLRFSIDHRNRQIQFLRGQPCENDAARPGLNTLMPGMGPHATPSRPPVAAPTRAPTTTTPNTAGTRPAQPGAANPYVGGPIKNVPTVRTTPQGSDGPSNCVTNLDGDCVPRR